MQRIKTELVLKAWLSLERGIVNYFYSFIFFIFRILWRWIWTCYSLRKLWDWRDGWVFKNTRSSCKGFELGSQHRTDSLQNIIKPSSGDLGTSRSAHTHGHQNPYIHIFLKKDCKMDCCLICTLTYVIGHILDTGWAKVPLHMLTGGLPRKKKLLGKRPIVSNTYRLGRKASSLEEQFYLSVNYYSDQPSYF